MQGKTPIVRGKEHCVNLDMVSCTPLLQFGLKDLYMDEMVGARRFGYCQTHGDFTIGFLLLRHSVVCTVESLCLL